MIPSSNGYEPTTTFRGMLPQSLASYATDHTCQLPPFNPSSNPSPYQLLRKIPTNLSWLTHSLPICHRYYSTGAALPQYQIKPMTTKFHGTTVPPKNGLVMPNSTTTETKSHACSTLSSHGWRWWCQPCNSVPLLLCVEQCTVMKRTALVYGRQF